MQENVGKEFLPLVSKPELDYDLADQNFLNSDFVGNVYNTGNISAFSV
jgi:hypothetical protein